MLCEQGEVGQGCKEIQDAWEEIEEARILEGVSGVKKLRRLGVWKEHLGIKGEWNLHENDIQKKQ